MGVNLNLKNHGEFKLWTVFLLQKQGVSALPFIFLQDEV